jgi:hypothetical protein
MILEEIPIFSTKTLRQKPILICLSQVFVSIIDCNAYFSQGQRVVRITLNSNPVAATLIQVNDYYLLVTLDGKRVGVYDISSNFTLGNYSFYDTNSETLLQVLYNKSVQIFLKNLYKITILEVDLEDLNVKLLQNLFVTNVVGMCKDLVFTVSGTRKITELKRIWDFCKSCSEIVSFDSLLEMGIWVDKNGTVTFRNGSRNFVKESAEIVGFLKMDLQFRVDQVVFFNQCALVFRFQNGFLALIEISEIDFTLKKVLYSQVFYPLAHIQVLENEQILVLDVKSRITKNNLDEISQKSVFSGIWNLFFPQKSFSILDLDDGDTVMELTSVMKLLPFEKLQRRLLFQDYSQALDVAETFSLDTDLVYKHQISDMIHVKQHVSFFKIEPVLEKIKNRKWVLDICLIPVQNPSLTRSLLDYVISQTNYLTKKDVEQEIDDFFEGRKYKSSLPLTPSEALRFRANALLRTDKLDLYEALFSGAGQDFSFISKLNSFYGRSYVDIAIELASKGNCSALYIFFSRLSSQILPYRFEILNAISSSVKINEYEDLIPKINLEGSVVEMLSFSYLRKRDWIETKGIIDFLHLLDDNSKFELQNDQYSSPSRADWLEWCKKRILSMESSNKSNAYELADLAVSRGFETECALIRDRISILNRIESSVFAEKLETIDLASLENVPPRHLLRSFLILADLESVGDLFTQIIIPYLEVIDEPFEVLRDVLLEISVQDLSLLANLAKSQVISKLKQFSTADDLKIMVMDCSLACNMDDTSENFDEILGFLMSPNESFEESLNDWNSDEEGINDEALKKDLPQIEEKKKVFAAYVKAKDILSEYNISKPLKWFAANLQTGTQQIQLLSQLLQNVNMNNSDWIRFLRQMDELIEDGTLGHVSRTKLYKDVLKIILSDAGNGF